MKMKPAVNSGKCRWLIGAIGSSDYCNTPVKYYMHTDEDGNRVRKYGMFCNKHNDVVAEMEASEEEF